MGLEPLAWLCLRGRPAAGPAARRANSERRWLGVYPRGPGRRSPARQRLTLSLPASRLRAARRTFCRELTRPLGSSGPLPALRRTAGGPQRRLQLPKQSAPSSAPFGSLRPAAASQPSAKTSLLCFCARRICGCAGRRRLLCALRPPPALRTDARAVHRTGGGCGYGWRPAGRPGAGGFCAAAENE